MSDRTFVDTNVLVYALDDSEPRKRDIARAALGSEGYGEFVLSAQVLSELYVAITRKLDRSVPEEQAGEIVEWLALFNATVSVDTALVRLGMQTSRAAQLSYWDGLIVAAAERSGALAS